MQVVAATEKLQQYHFDFIAVSSMWRTRHTILPYLKTTGAKGEIWPELHEVDGGSMVLSTNLPSPSGEILNAGPRVELSSEEAPYFTFREGATNDFKLPAARGNEHEAAVRFALQHAIDMIHKRFGGTDKSILLVGHGNSGRALLKLLTGNKLTGIPGMANAKIWMVEEQPNGQFKFEMYNDAPYEDNKAVSASSSISSSTVNGETVIRFQGKEVWRGKADGPVFTRSTALGGKAYGAAFAGDKVLWESEPGAANMTRKQ
jgi:broad specificity phosphatase PhoE